MTDKMHTKKKELDALIRLLDEPDNHAFDQIRDKILFYGKKAIPLLEDAWDNSFDNLLQERIADIIHLIQTETVFNELSDWKSSGAQDLMKGMILVTRYQYPDLNTDSLMRKIEDVRKDIWIEINENLTALEKIKVVNHIVFDIHNITGNRTNFDNPGNYFMNELMETKRGNPLSLGVLYMYLCRSLDIPVLGVDLPQHFILAYMDEVSEEKISLPDEDRVLFYINPFNRGAVFTRKEIEVFLKQLQMKPQKSYFLPCSNITIVKRVIQNLQHAFKKSGNIQKARELHELEKTL